MGLRFIKPVGFYSPLIAVDNWNKVGSAKVRWLAFVNLLLRFISYPVNYAVSALITLGAILIATFFNVTSLLGGFFSDYWSQKTKLFNQIAITRCQWLIFDPLAFLYNQGILIAGMFSSKYASETLSRLQKVGEELTKTNLFHFDWYLPHKKAVKSFINFLDKHELHGVGLTVGTLAIEPVEAFLFGLKAPFGLAKDFNILGLNPKKLTKEQTAYPPLLLLHGNYHNQSAWLPLAEYFKSKGYPGPIFTVNLNSGELCIGDDKIIANKMKFIKKLYKAQNVSDIKINVIGHSRGAQIAIAKAEQFDKIILLGKNPAYRYLISGWNDNKTIVVINGDSDAFLTFDPQFGGFFVKAGHLGVLSHSEALEKCYNTLIKSSNKSKEETFINPMKKILSQQTEQSTILPRELFCTQDVGSYSTKFFKDQPEALFVGYDKNDRISSWPAP